MVGLDRKSQGPRIHKPSGGNGASMMIARMLTWPSRRCASNAPSEWATMIGGSTNFARRDARPWHSRSASPSAGSRPYAATMPTNAQRSTRPAAFGGMTHKPLRPDPRPAKGTVDEQDRSAGRSWEKRLNEFESGSRPRATRNRVATDPPGASGKDCTNRSWHHSMSLNLVSSDGQRSQLHISSVLSSFLADVQRCRSPHMVECRKGLDRRNLLRLRPFCLSNLAVAVKSVRVRPGLWRGHGDQARTVVRATFAYPQRRDRPSPQPH